VAYSLLVPVEISVGHKYLLVHISFMIFNLTVLDVLCSSDYVYFSGIARVG
jgi:hypothetical protein